MQIYLCVLSPLHLLPDFLISPRTMLSLNLRICRRCFDQTLAQYVNATRKSDKVLFARDTTSITVASAEADCNGALADSPRETRHFLSRTKYHKNIVYSK